MQAELLTKLREMAEKPCPGGCDNGQQWAMGDEDNHDCSTCNGTGYDPKTAALRDLLKYYQPEWPLFRMLLPWALDQVAFAHGFMVKKGNLQWVNLTKEGGESHFVNTYPTSIENQIVALHEAVCQNNTTSPL